MKEVYFWYQILEHEGGQYWNIVLLVIRQYCHVVDLTNIPELGDTGTIKNIPVLVNT